MQLNASILYRGDLSSCNYDCPYCPFAKHWESAEELRSDQEGLDRFCSWVADRGNDRLGIFFTPWGEALVRPWYREAVVELSQRAQVRKVAVQTNLSCSLHWLSEADATKIGLWCTYHPGQTAMDNFLRQCERLDLAGVRYSVGCVGLREHLPYIEELRKSLPKHVYLWVNAYKSRDNYYESSDREAFEAVDPLFPINNVWHSSRGHACHTGHSLFTVDSRGDVRRCHFVDDIIGNIYKPNFERNLLPRPCPNETCGCHIGYVHLKRLQLYPVFGDGLLERIPVSQLPFESDAGEAAPVSEG